MSREEYDKMVETGKVQPGGGGQTYAAFTREGCIKEAAKDAIYVVFEVPEGSVRITDKERGWVVFLSPDSIEGKLAIRKGLVALELPFAKNIRFIGGK